VRRRRLLSSNHDILSFKTAGTGQAIAAFEGLAQRLEAMAEARRPWWRRLVG
jgi:hypothetical protein